jgi:hypothetical protein
MKTKFIFLTFLAFAIGGFFSSCEAPQQDNMTQAYKNGEILMNKIINLYYRANEDVNFTGAYQQQLAELLAGNALDTIQVEQLQLVDNITKKIEIFSFYEKILQSAQTDIAGEQIKGEIISLLDAVDSLNNEKYSEKTKKIEDYVKAVNMQPAIAVYEVSDLVYQIYQDDVLSWLQILTAAYNKYAATIDNIPDDVFDEQKLEKFVYQPYKGKKTLIDVYKLNLKQDAYEAKTKFNDKATMLMSIFDEFESVVQELSKKSPDRNYVYFSNEKIFTQLKTLDNE